MAENSKIEWTTHTFNPWRGCTKVSAGCAHCYAETLSGRNPKVLGMWGPNGTRVVASEAKWLEPVKWNRDAEDRFDRIGDSAFATGDMLREASARPRVFCASLADVFEDWTGPITDSREHIVKVNRNGDVGDWEWYADTLRVGRNVAKMSDVRARLFNLIDATPNLDWLLLTKRPENIASMMAGIRDRNGLDQHKISRILGSTIANPPAMPSNVWLGTSVENQTAADERIPHLLRVPAAVRFLSCEPLLSDVNIRRYFHHSYRCPAYAPPPAPVSYRGCEGCTCEGRIDWVIVGGESGPGARPCNVAWIRSIVEQCKAAGVPCFVKQLGSVPMVNCATCHDNPYWARTLSSWRRCPECGLRGPRDKKGGDPAEWPEDLRVRKFPEVKAGVA